MHTHTIKNIHISRRPVVSCHCLLNFYIFLISFNLYSIFNLLYKYDSFILFSPVLEIDFMTTLGSEKKRPLFSYKKSYVCILFTYLSYVLILLVDRVFVIHITFNFQIFQSFYTNLKILKLHGSLSLNTNF